MGQSLSYTNYLDGNKCRKELKIAADYVTVEYASKEKGGNGAVLAYHPIDKHHERFALERFDYPYRIPYFEMRVEKLDGYCEFGLSAGAYEWPEFGTAYLYNSIGQIMFNRHLRGKVSSFRVGDIVGCGVLYREHCVKVFFTKNGRQVGAHCRLCGPYRNGYELFPYFALNTYGDKISAIFEPSQFRFKDFCQVNKQVLVNFWSNFRGVDCAVYGYDQSLARCEFDKNPLWRYVFGFPSIYHAGVEALSKTRFYYFEMKVNRMRRTLFFGIARKPEAVGGEVNGMCCYYNSGSICFNDAIHMSGYPEFGVGDTVGCCVVGDYNDAQVFFTKNGEEIGVKSELSYSTGHAFPFICFGHQCDEIEANFFGPDFLFDPFFVCSEKKKKAR